MSFRSATAKMVIAVAGLLVFEAINLYLYSILFLLEGQPQQHGNTHLRAWAWVCIASMLIGLLLFVYVVGRILTSKQHSDDGS